MIQRIQSIYLLVGALILVAFLAMSPVRVGAAAATYGWFFPTVAVVAVLSTALAVGTIFMYKDRHKQRRLVVMVQGVSVLLILVAFAGFFLSGQIQTIRSEGVDAQMILALVLPLLAYVCFFMARRAIDRDIKLVQSMDRLR